MTDLVHRDGDRLLFDWEKIVEQDKVWIDVTGREHRIEGMDDRYRGNALNWLIRNQGRALLELMIGRYSSGPRPNGEMAQDAFDSEFDQLLWMDPKDYILETPLGQALSEHSIDD
jgi:hypothetical protein